MDTLMLERKQARRRSPPSVVEKDPWLTEILLVEAHGKLQVPYLFPANCGATISIASAP